jgi:DNA polymerase
VSKYPGAEEFLPDRRTVAAMARAVQDCQGCDLFEDATQAVFGQGARRPDLVLVGEQPGDQEDRQGAPFVGPAGRLLDRGLRAAQIDPDRVYLTNAVKHFRYRTEGKRRIHQTPTMSQMVACRPWLVAELAELRPQGLVVLGATAGRALLGSDFRVGAVRGDLLDAPEDYADWLVATVHPSSVLRSRNRDDEYAAFVADLAVAASALT